MIIKVFSIIDKVHAVSTEDGEKLYRKITENFEMSQVVELNFDGIKLILSAFLNASIGQLYSRYESSYLQQHLILSHISNEDLTTLKKVTDRAKEYFGDRKNFENTAKRT